PADLRQMKGSSEVCGFILGEAEGLQEAQEVANVWPLREREDSYDRSAPPIADDEGPESSSPAS
ncbi:MAG: hypothetical protein QOI81_1889, partial [Actinomycetota bacterium]|nr:hypothetical protein [Actinomycetota bacterium]